MNVDVETQSVKLGVGADVGTLSIQVRLCDH